MKIILTLSCFCTDGNKLNPQVGCHLCGGKGVYTKEYDNVVEYKTSE